MYIKSIRIASFGMFSDFSLDFEQGVNVIEGGNETGKTTIGAFIRFMFYGISGEERARYGAGRSRLCGSIVFGADDGNYKIERELTILDKGFRENVNIIDLATNMPIHKNESPADVFLGVPERVFESTVFVSQMDGARVAGEKLTDAVENILFSASETTNTARAARLLDAERVSLWHKNKKGGLLFDLGEQIASLEIKLRDAQEHNSRLFDLEEKLRNTSAQLAQKETDRRTLEAKIREYEAYRKLDTYSRFLSLKEEYTGARDALEAMRVSFDGDGERYNQEYMRFLSDAASSLRHAEKETADAEAALAAGSRTSPHEDDTFLTAAADLGGEEAVTAQLCGAAKRSRSRKTAAFILLAGAILSAGGAAALYALRGSRAALLYGAMGAAGLAVLFLILFILFLVLSGKAKKSAEETLLRLDCRDAEEVALRFAEIARAKADAEKQEAARLLLETTLTERRAEEKRLRAEIFSGLSPKSAALCAGEDGVTAEFLFEEYTRSEALRESLREASDKVRELGASAAAAQTEAAGIDPEETRREIKGVLRPAEVPDFNAREHVKKAELLQQQCVSLSELQRSQEKEHASLSAVSIDSAAVQDTLSAVRGQRDEARMKYEAYVMALSCLEAAGTNLRDSVSPKLASYASKAMHVFSGGKYRTLGVDNQYAVSFSDGDLTRDIVHMSAGTQDIAYISLRLALADTLYRKQKPFLIFDDSFVHLDDRRLSNMLRLLSGMSEEGLQSLIFTCHKRERETIFEIGSANIIQIK